MTKFKEQIIIHTPYIQLNQALKLLGWADNGGIANEFITQGLVVVDGVVEYRKRNKLFPDACIEFDGKKAIVMARL
ncbi:MAG: RNA-binding S4 domain-containing protein [Bacteroidetes bacterium]|nr:RNA-binding S4 domain-containing protein [Bacteroidota bacterium]MSP58419.1 RNA-binding S4 domain-containing protein [Flavobacteriaceae bacterium]PHX93238.1 MAG: ribosome-associated protein [Flavobacteriales bacterium]